MAFGLPHFGTDLEEFVRLLLAGEVRWTPREGRPGYASLVVLEETCHRCRKDIGVVAAVELLDDAGLSVGMYHSDDPEATPYISSLTADPDFRQQYKIGPLRERYSKTVGGRYYANSCLHCDALQGAFFIKKLLMGHEVTDCTPNGVGRIPLIFNAEQAQAFGRWRSLEEASAAGEI